MSMSGYDWPPPSGTGFSLPYSQPGLSNIGGASMGSTAPPSMSYQNVSNFPSQYTNTTGGLPSQYQSGNVFQSSQPYTGGSTVFQSVPRSRDAQRAGLRQIGTQEGSVMKGDLQPSNRDYQEATTASDTLAAWNAASNTQGSLLSRRKADLRTEQGKREFDAQYNRDLDLYADPWRKSTRGRIGHKKVGYSVKDKILEVDKDEPTSHHQHTTETTRSTTGGSWYDFSMWNPARQIASNLSSAIGGLFGRSTTPTQPTTAPNSTGVFGQPIYQSATPASTGVFGQSTNQPAPAGFTGLGQQTSQFQPSMLSGQQVPQSIPSNAMGNGAFYTPQAPTQTTLNPSHQVPISQGPLSMPGQSSQLTAPYPHQIPQFPSRLPQPTQPSSHAITQPTSLDQPNTHGAQSTAQGQTSGQNTDLVVLGHTEQNGSQVPITVSPSVLSILAPNMAQTRATTPYTQSRTNDGFMEPVDGLRDRFTSLLNLQTNMTDPTTGRPLAYDELRRPYTVDPSTGYRSYLPPVEHGDHLFPPGSRITTFGDDKKTDYDAEKSIWVSHPENRLKMKKYKEETGVEKITGDMLSELMYPTAKGEEERKARIARHEMEKHFAWAEEQKRINAETPTVLERPDWWRDDLTLPSMTNLSIGRSTFEGVEQEHHVSDVPALTKAHALAFFKSPRCFRNRELQTEATGPVVFTVVDRDPDEMTTGKVNIITLEDFSAPSDGRSYKCRWTDGQLNEEGTMLSYLLPRSQWTESPTGEKVPTRTSVAVSEIPDGT